MPTSDKLGFLVGPAIRRPLDPDQNARNVEAVLKVIDPDTNQDINLLKCTSLSWSRLPGETCSLVCRGHLITKNQELLKRISCKDVLFTWRVASTAGPQGEWIATLQTVPDFTRDEVEIEILY
jgi:hypothetical protein